jgi:membrane associated rhomboid family serine protease
MADLSVSRSTPDPSQIASQLDRRVYKLISPSQRHYYRSGLQSPESFWLLHGNKIVTGSVIGICVAGFAANGYAKYLAQRTRDYKLLEFIRRNFVSSLENVKAGRWWVMATSSVMHTNWIHLGCNMWALWSIGPFAMSYFRVTQFLGLWLVSAVSCSAASLYWTHFKEELRREKAVGRTSDSHPRPQWTRYINLGSGNSMEYYGGAVGASGSLSGLFTTMMCIMPRVRVSVFPITFVSFPLWLGNAFFATGSAYCMVTGAIPLISHAGHLGGLAGGLVYYLGVIRPFLRIRGRRV